MTGSGEADGIEPGRDNPAPDQLLVRPSAGVWWVSVGWVCLLLAFSVLTPLFQAPDEPQHVDRVLDAASRAGFEEPVEGEMRNDISQLASQWRAGYFPPRFSVERAPEHPRPSMDDLGLSEPQSGGNQQTQHPPAYYAVMATSLRAITSWLPDDVWSADREVLLLRLLNVLIMLPLPYLCWATAVQLGWPHRVALTAALVPLAVPQLAFIGASVNNDNLVVLASSVTFLACAAALRRRLDVRTGLVLAGSTAVALLSKGNAIALVPLVVIVGVVGWRRGGSERRVAVAAMAGAAAGGIFYLRNVLLYGEPLPTTFINVADRTEPLDIAAFLQSIVAKTSESFWGKFGWLTVPIPKVWSYILMSVLVLAVVVALVRRPLGYLRVMMVPTGAALLVYLANAFKGYEDSGVFPAQQGRYLFLCIVPVALAVAAVAHHRERTARRALSVLIVVNHVLAVVVLFDFYWPGGFPGGFLSIAAWSPLGNAVIGLLVACWLALVWSLVALERGAVHRSDPDRGGEDEGSEVRREPVITTAGSVE